MSVFLAQNSRGHFTMDRTRFGYAYLGKIPLPSGIGQVQFSCVGYPLMFISIPYNIPDDTGQQVQNASYKVGCLIAGASNNGNTWTVTTIVNDYPNRASVTQYLRIFVRVDLNWPNGSGRIPNLKLRTDNNQLVFDAGLRMLKLAGDTYDTELVLGVGVPAWSEANNKYDAVVGVPFDLANKSIAVSPRSNIAATYYYGSYQDWDTNQTVNQFYRYYWDTVFAAYGNGLRILKSPRSQIDRIESNNDIIDVGGALPNYSRLAVIDNAKYP